MSQEVLLYTKDTLIQNERRNAEEIVSNSKL